MQTLENISCFTLVDDKLVYASDKSVHWLDKSVSFEESPFRFKQTKDFLIVVTGNKNISFLIKKEDLGSQVTTWLKVPRFVSIFSRYYERNQILLHSDIFRDETTWIYSLNDHTEKEYSFLVRFVPNCNYIYVSNSSSLLFLDAWSGNTIAELKLVVKKNQPFFAPKILGELNNIIWIRIKETEIIGYDVNRSEIVKSFDLFKLISSAGFESNAIGFGDHGNPYNFHVDFTEHRIITFANRYYCEISLLNFSSKIIDLNDVCKGENLRIVSSRWCNKRKWLFFIGRADYESFSRYFGIFNTQSQTFIDVGKTKEKSEFFASPPKFGIDRYGMLSTKKVLYLKDIK